MKFCKKITIMMTLGLMGLSLASCKTDGDGGSLNVTVRPAGVYALPVKSTSCVAATTGGTADLSAPSVSYNMVTLVWTDASKTFTLAYLDMFYSSPALSGGISHNYIADNELAALFPSGVTLAAMTNPSSPPTMTSNAACGMRAGSIPLFNQQSSAFVTGVLKVVGYTTDSSGNTAPVQLQIPISFQWDGIQ